MRAYNKLGNTVFQMLFWMGVIDITIWKQQVISRYINEACFSLSVDSSFGIFCPYGLYHEMVYVYGRLLFATHQLHLA